MGGAASVCFQGVAYVPDFDHTIFPKHGVALPYLEECIAQCGGRDALDGLTTTEMCEKFVKPVTARFKCSLLDLMREAKHPHFRAQADVFISHAWKFRFLDVVSALQHHFRDRPDIVIWFDLFSNNQHRASELPFEWWSTTFREAIQSFGYTVLVLAPWNDPIPLKRAWCLFEIYQTVSTGSKFEIAMSNVDTRRLLGVSADVR
jgi:hypothetical protein